MKKKHFFFDKQLEKPIFRPDWRRQLGKLFYQLKRKINWHFSDKKFAKVSPNQLFENQIATHSSVLLRKLKDVDMYLQHNKIENLRLAVARLNGVVIQPNETFSLWKLVGKPTKQKGYKEGMTLVQGKVQTGIGGGLCQLGNLIHWLTLHTPLSVTERYRHGFDVFPDSNRTIPFGSGATLSYNYIDLQITNTTNQPFQLMLWLSKELLHGAYFSKESLSKKYQVYEKEHQFVAQPWGGYSRHNSLYRKIVSLETEEEIADELLLENHAILMYEPFLQTEK